MLRAKHGMMVDYFKRKLAEKGIPQLESKSHIIPIPVGNPMTCNYISNELLNRFGHYVQAINYPTVAKGEERLRIAPSPRHTYQLIDEFIDDFLVVWNEVTSAAAAVDLNVAGTTTNTTTNITTAAVAADNQTCSQCNRSWVTKPLDFLPCGSQQVNCPLAAARC